MIDARMSIWNEAKLNRFAFHRSSCAACIADHDSFPIEVCSCMLSSSLDVLGIRQMEDQAALMGGITSGMVSNGRLRKSDGD